MVKTKGVEANLSSDKLLQIIEYMSARRLPVRLKDISDNLQISQPTVLRYLRTMCNQGYVYHDDHTGFYAMTWKICRLSSSLESNLVLRSMAGSLLSDFANRHNLGILLAVEREGSLVYLDLVGAPHGSVNTMLRIGKDAPMHSTASGKILLSTLIGSVIAVANFAAMCLTVQSAVGMEDQKKMKAKFQLSYNVRMIVQAGWSVAAFLIPGLHFVAAAAPILFPKVTILYLNATGKLMPREEAKPEASRQTEE